MERLAVSGFVLAGGLSSRMGTDKALLKFCGRPMVEIAVAKLREFCAEVLIAGNRDDLRDFAPVVQESRVEAGPAGGVEAALGFAAQAWAVFVPVDVPLVSADLLQEWTRAVIARGCAASYLVVDGQKQPAFCVLRRECLGVVTAALDRGERRLAEILTRLPEAGLGELWRCDAATLASAASCDAGRAFSNINTVEDMRAAEQWAAARSGKIAGQVEKTDRAL